MAITPETPVLRPYTKDDAAATLTLFLDAITVTAANDYSPEQVRAWARAEHRDPESWHLGMAERASFVATVNAEVTGFSDVDDSGYIDMLFVAPRHGRKGVGRTLLAEAERRVRQRGGRRLSATVSVTARPLFERSGFSVTSEQHPLRDGVSLPSFRMHRVLPAHSPGPPQLSSPSALVLPTSTA